MAGGGCPGCEREGNLWCWVGNGQWDPVGSVRGMLEGSGWGVDHGQLGESKWHRRASSIQKVQCPLKQKKFGLMRSRWGHGQRRLRG